MRAQPDIFDRTGQVMVPSADQSARTFVIRKDRVRWQQFDWNWTTVAVDAVDNKASTGQTAARPHLVASLLTSGNDFALRPGRAVKQ